MQNSAKEILGKNSEKNFAKLSAEELTNINNAIDDLTLQIENFDDEQSKYQLINLRFGESQNSVLHLVAKFGNSEQMQKIFDSFNHSNCADIKNSDDFTALHFAAIRGDVELTQILIAANANINAKTSASKRHWSAIHYAAKFGHLKIVKILLDNGVDKEIKTAFGLTPLLVAAEFGHAAIIQFLLSAGANINVQTIEENHAMNALHYAVLGNFGKAVNILLLAKIDYAKETITNLTAFEFAAKNNLVEMVKLLLQWQTIKLESALKIAQSNKNNETEFLIKKYQQAKAKFFNVKFLQNSSPDLVKMINQFDAENLSEAKFYLSPEVAINAFGLLSLEQKFGFFSKKEQSLFDFAVENNLTALKEALKRLKTLAEKNTIQSYEL
jgi:ankyrin repeat protein